MRTLVAVAVLAVVSLSACSQEPAPTQVAWPDVTGKPDTFPAEWSAVAGRPATFPSNWADVAARPETFPTTWPQVAGVPSSFPSSWDEVTSKPATFPATWDEVAAKPSTFPTTWDQVAARPSSYPTTWDDVAGRPATFPADWSGVANRPSTFPVDPVKVQLRVTAACAEGGYMTAVQQDGSVTCASRVETVQLPTATWATFQCATVTAGFGALGGMALPAIRFQPPTACTGVRRASTVLTVPLELPSGPRLLRVRAIVTEPLVAGAATLTLGWRVPAAASGVGAVACSGSKVVTIPALPSVQAMTTVEYDFRDDPSMCAEPGSPIVLNFDRTDTGAGELVVESVYAVLE